MHREGRSRGGRSRRQATRRAQKATRKPDHQRNAKKLARRRSGNENLWVVDGVWVVGVGQSAAGYIEHILGSTLHSTKTTCFFRSVTGGWCSKPRVFSVGDGGMTEQTTCFIGWMEHAVFAHPVFYGVSVSSAPWPGRANVCSNYWFWKFLGVLTIGLNTL